MVHPELPSLHRPSLLLVASLVYYIRTLVKLNVKTTPSRKKIILQTSQFNPIYRPILVFRGGGVTLKQFQRTIYLQSSAHVTWISAFHTFNQTAFSNNHGGGEWLFANNPLIFQGTIYILNHDSWEETCNKINKKNRYKTTPNWNWTFPRSSSACPQPLALDRRSFSNKCAFHVKQVPGRCLKTRPVQCM